MKGKFQFSNVVVVHDNLVGVIVKTWQILNAGSSNRGVGTYSYDVYIRSYNTIENLHEDEIRHFVYDKELSDESLEYYD